MTQENKHNYKFRVHPCGEFLQFFKDKELIEDLGDASIFCKQANHFYPLLEICRQIRFALFSGADLSESFECKCVNEFKCLGHILEQAIKAAEEEV